MRYNAVYHRLLVAFLTASLAILPGTSGDSTSSSAPYVGPKFFNRGRMWFLDDSNYGGVTSFPEVWRAVKKEELVEALNKKMLNYYVGKATLDQLVFRARFFQTLVSHWPDVKRIQIPKGVKRGSMQALTYVPNEQDSETLAKSIGKMADGTPGFNKDNFNIFLDWLTSQVDEIFLVATSHVTQPRHLVSTLHTKFRQELLAGTLTSILTTFKFNLATIAQTAINCRRQRRLASPST